MSARGNRLLTIPNLLSLSRVPLGGLFWIALGPASRSSAPALGVLAAAAVTDVLDGHIARKQGIDLSGTGSWLDPICDKVFVAGILGALHFERGISFGLLALIVTRELLQLPMAVAYRASHTLRSWLRYDFRASPLGKAATIAQFLAIAAVVIGLPALGPALGAFALGAAALIDYVRRAVALGQQRLSAAGGAVGKGAPPSHG
jgi:cardiolipin synthase (CMP-forming)